MRRVGEEPEAERLEAGPRRRGDGGVAARRRLPRPSRSIISSATSSWNITAIAGVQGVSPFAANSRALGEVEVGARHLRRSRWRPSARSDSAIIAMPGADHPRLLRAGDDDVEAPGVHLERHAAEAGDAVDEDQRVGRRLVDGRGDLLRAGS